MSPVQEQVLALISAGSTISDAARSAGVHRNTVGYWLRTSPAFHDALERANYIQALYWRDQANQIAGSAISAIQQIIEDDSVSPGTRLRAALVIFQMATNAPKSMPAPAASFHSTNPSELEHLTVDPPAAAPAASPENVHKNEQRMPAAPAPSILTIRNSGPKIGRNDTCPCGSGLKFKRCCLGKTVSQAVRAAAA